MNVKEAARCAGTSVRALRYYEEVGLIRPRRSPDNDYRDYDGETIGRVRLIRAYRELQFSLEEIRRLLTAPRMERDAMLQIHIDKLEQRRQQLDNRIALAISLRMNGPERLTEIDFASLDEQMAQAQKNLDANEAWKALSERFKRESKERADAIARDLARHLTDVATAPEADVPAAIDRLRRYIDANYYPCTDQILLVYARSFGGDGLLAETIDELGGPNASQKLRARIEKQIGPPSGPICPK